MIIKPAQRTESVKEYFFSIKNRERAALNKKRAAVGKDPVINLGIGAPDGMPPASTIEKLCESAHQPDSHKYQPYNGTAELRNAFSAWYKRWYGVDLDPESEIQPLMGSKEGILIIFLSFINPGDKVLVPDPGYPTYTAAAQIVGADLVKYDLKHENGWLPKIEDLEKMDLDGVKMMWINYPNMPTGAMASHECYQQIVDFCNRHGILLVSDNPYSFVLTDDHQSVLSCEGAKKCCIEMNSLSKASNMSGWRVGMVAGDAEYIKLLLKIKSQMDSGTFKPIQMAAVDALSQGQDWYDKINVEYARRKKVVFEMFDLLGVTYDTNTAGLFVWGHVNPDNKYLSDDTSKTLGERMSDRLMYGAGVFITPGMAFGKNGNDYVRASLCAPVPVLEDAIRKIKTEL